MACPDLGLRGTRLKRVIVDGQETYSTESSGSTTPIIPTLIDPNLLPHGGALDYQAYKQQLRRLGHVKDTPERLVNSPLLNHRPGYRTDNKTDWRADQANISIHNLPGIMYALDRPHGWLPKSRLKEPPLKTYDIYGERPRDIPCLPDHISSELEGWRLEYWARLDPRIRWHKDIAPRMNPKTRPTNQSKTQMARLRFRENFPALGWVNLGGNHKKIKSALLHALEEKGISFANNTTRGVSWGLVDPMKGETGGRIAVHENLQQPWSVGDPPAWALAKTVHAPPPAQEIVYLAQPITDLAPVPHFGGGRGRGSRSPSPGRKRKAPDDEYSQEVGVLGEDDEEEEGEEDSRDKYCRAPPKKKRMRKLRQRAIDNDLGQFDRSARGVPGVSTRSGPRTATPETLRSSRMVSQAINTPTEDATRNNFDQRERDAAFEHRLAQGGWYDNTGYFPVLYDNHVGDPPALNNIHFADDPRTQPAMLTSTSASTDALNEDGTTGYQRPVVYSPSSMGWLGPCLDSDFIPQNDPNSACPELDGDAEPWGAYFRRRTQ